jgi:hypothetical protein
MPHYRDLLISSSLCLYAALSFSLILSLYPFALFLSLALYVSRSFFFDCDLASQLFVSLSFPSVNNFSAGAFTRNPPRHTHTHSCHMHLDTGLISHSLELVFYVILMSPNYEILHLGLLLRDQLPCFLSGDALFERFVRE